MEEIKGSVIVHLESLPNSVLDTLYRSPASCLAILKLLPDLAKHLLYRLLYVTDSVEKNLIDGWIVDQKRSNFKEIMRQLSKLQILRQENNMVSMNQNYQSSLHNALIGRSGDCVVLGTPTELQDKNGDISNLQLDKFALASWESVLHYLVGTSQDNRTLAVVQLLEKSGLMVKEKGQLTITSKGFQFLLQDMNIQIWALLLQYLELSQSLQMEPVEVLNFLFQLSSLDFGQDYPVDPLTPTQKYMLSDLKCLGLIFQRNKKSARFYPTRLATTLATGSLGYAIGDNLDAEQISEKGYILIETNFKVYAYTNSTLQIAILSLFVQMQTRFPNMVVGMITRDSIRDALSKGISADQIVAYLTSHAHPQMKTTTPILPSTIVDQIRLWEMEKNRLRSSVGVLYQDFPRDQDYREVLNQAEDFGYVLWKSDAQKRLVLSADGHEHVRNWLKEKQKRLNQ